MRKYFSFILLLSLFTGTLNAQFIYVEGTNIMLNGKPVYMNGCNTPWHKWNDFGGNYDPIFWEKEFKKLNKHGINSSRIWFSCNGDVQPEINAEGYVTGVSDAFWQHTDDLMNKAKKYNIYIMATMISFDHVKNTYNNYERWRMLFNDSAKTQSLVHNYIIPFVERYKDNPYLFCIDLANEIEWMHENEECGKLSWEVLQRYIAMGAAAIHRTPSKALVSIGASAIKWNSDTVPGAEGNKWSDANLQAQYNDPLARMDIWNIHYYHWVNEWYGNPFTKSPAEYGINDRPVLVGEMPGKPSDLPGITFDEAYKNLYTLGYRGHYPWSSNGIDDHGHIKYFGKAALRFKKYLNKK